MEFAGVQQKLLIVILQACWHELLEQHEKCNEPKMYEAAVQTRHISRTNSFVYDDEDCNNQHQIVSDLRRAAQEW